MKSSTIYDKNSQHSGNRGNIPKHNKGHMWASHFQHHTQWAKATSLPLEIRHKTGMSAFTSLIQHSTGYPSHSSQTRRKIKGIQLGKEDVKLTLFADDMILYIENPKDSTKKLLELINEFIKAAGYKITIQKSVAFLYANNELREKEIKKTISFTMLQKKNKNT